MTITSADGTRLAARHTGHGSPIVLVHGANGDLDTFALVEGMLAEHHTVWVYSRRGRGGSSDGPGYALEPRDRRPPRRPCRRRRPRPPRRTLWRRHLQPPAATEPPPLRSLVLYEPPLRFERFDPTVIDQVQAALDASDEDRALEIIFAAIGVAEPEVHVLRSVEAVWKRLRAGVRLVPASSRPGSRRSIG